MDRQARPPGFQGKVIVPVYWILDYLGPFPLRLDAFRCVTCIYVTPDPYELSTPVVVDVTRERGKTPEVDVNRVGRLMCDSWYIGTEICHRHVRSGACMLAW